MFTDLLFLFELLIYSLPLKRMQGKCSHHRFINNKFEHRMKFKDKVEEEEEADQKKRL